MYRLIIFDLDGTILNTLEDLADSTNYALSLNHFPERTLEEVRNFVGNGIGKLIERAVPEGTDKETEEKVLKDFTEYYGAHCADKTRPYDGVVEVIKSLRAQGFLTAVVSNKADFAVQELCEQYFPRLFDYVVGEREGIRRKPAPDSALQVLDTLQVDKSEALYVGDSEVDIQTAKNAGLAQISVEWGFRKKEFLLQQGAVQVIRTPEEILNIC
jgi:phosphoglycolate phosphatase